ncbi:CopD family protein [Limobrevibacterium gyesilva]|uniref:CopD family protein n=1 Tax=Limobrevibacterium gyesilva TaxID=2991712 RepID=A0AA41YIG3_9PROT|nr:CopD family protein [Limobrevibacterium gyesilva]MCW3473634.1 CopD family protein [Limobrevibacterium gyesilva]
MSAADALLAAVRAVHLAATMSLAGALAFRLLIGPLALARVLRPSLAVASIAGAAWLALQAGALAGASDVAGTLAALVPATLQTRFGRMLLLRLGLLVAAVLLAGSGARRLRLLAGLVCAMAAVALQATVGHAAASEDPVLVASLALHLLAAAAWLGGLVPLWLALRGPTPALVAQRFSWLGIAAVVVIAATAVEQGAVLAGGAAGLVGTPYGWSALAKTGLFLAMLGLAAVNRFVLTPAVAQADSAVRRLRASIAAELILGLCVVAAAAAMTGLPPGAHEQPDWPFSRQPSLVAMQDPDLRREVVGALLALCAVGAILVLAACARRLRWPALAVAAAITMAAAPHLDLLLVPATPTSFYTSPTGFAAVGIARGAGLFAHHCAACHGAHGRGDGVLAKGLDIPPADLTAEHLWDHPDGEMYWWLTHGIESPRGGLSMPGFADRLDADARWALIDFVRANNAGRAIRHDGTWTRPIPAPALQAVCGDGRNLASDDLRGQPVVIVIGPPAPTEGVATIFLDDGKPPAGACVAAGREVRDAYAIVAGLEPQAQRGAAFLVDGAGWLRQRLDPGLDGRAIAAAIERLATTTAAAPPAAGHHHH